MQNRCTRNWNQICIKVATMVSTSFLEQWVGNSQIIIYKTQFSINKSTFPLVKHYSTNQKGTKFCRQIRSVIVNYYRNWKQKETKTHIRETKTTNFKSDEKSTQIHSLKSYTENRVGKGDRDTSAQKRNRIRNLKSN